MDVHVEEECVCCGNVDTFLSQEEVNAHLVVGKTGGYWCLQCKPEEDKVEEVASP